jgi:L-xylulose reductase
VKPFEGKRILVTGAGKGIGRDTALYLAEQGADVIAISRTEADLLSLREAAGCQILPADLANVEEARRAAEAAGTVDYLVNNAGISILQPFLEARVEDFDHIMAVNVRAVLVISQVIARNMIRNGIAGAIVNVSSQSSMRAVKDHTAYCTSKCALDQLTRMMALELGPHHIRVNSVNPTVTLTPMGEMAWGDPAKSGPVLARIPLGHFAQPVDVARVIAYLLSDQAAMIHGAILPIDGGFLVT